MCDFSEKAIMLCKAAVMGDAEKFHEIAKAEKPYVAKQLGRQVRAFDEATWKALDVAGVVSGGIGSVNDRAQVKQLHAVLSVLLFLLT